MNSFRARYDPRAQAGPGRLCVEVIGFHCRRTGIYRAPEGIPAWRVMMFHEPVEVKAGATAHATKAHTAFVFADGQPTEYGRASGTWSHSWVRVTGSAVAALVAEAGVPLGEGVHFGRARESDTWLGLLHRELHHRAGPDAQIVRHLLSVWLRQIARCARRAEMPLPPEEFVAAKQFIETHYLEEVRLERLAALAHVSRQHFCERFRRHFGATPVAYAIQLRMQHAIELLGDVNLNVTEVARASGFGDIFYFSRAFRKHTGVSPRAYRAR